MKRFTFGIVASGLPLLMVCATAAAADVRPTTPTQPQPIVPGVPILPTSPVDIATRTLRVGPGGDYATPSAAAAVAKDGDTIEIASGDYRGDAAVWTANRLHIVGHAPRPRILADPRGTSAKGVWVMRGDDATVENVDVSGSRLPDRTGAAIVVEGRNFVLRDSALHDSDNGLVVAANATSEVVVEHCEFARNGAVGGQSHNLAVGAIARLTVSRSYLHHAVLGHDLRSGATTSILTDNRFADEADGRASLLAAFPTGGRVTLAFNIFQKAASNENPTLVSYGEDGLASGGTHELIAKGNTFVSRRPAGARFLVLAPGVQANINGNVFAGIGTLPDVPNIRANNAVQRDMPGNVDLKPDGFP